MSRRDSFDDDAPEREQIYPPEMPLPSYEEVVGSQVPPVGFVKTAPRMYPSPEPERLIVAVEREYRLREQRRAEARLRGPIPIITRPPSDTFYAPSSTRACRKGLLFVILTMILVPIFALIIVIKSQACTPPDPQNLDSMYTTCMGEKMELQKQLDVIANPGKVKESVQEYQDRLIEKENLESSLQKLRQEYATLSEQKAKLMTTTTTTTTIAPQHTTQRKKSKKEQLDELFDVNNFSVNRSLNDMIKRAQEIMNSRDEW